MEHKIYFGSPISWDCIAKDPQEAAKKYGEQVKKGRIIPPKNLGMLVRLRIDEGQWKYWDVRVFLKHAKMTYEEA